MKILVIGSGAREHAIITALLSETEQHEVLAAPGNAGIAELARCIDFNVLDGHALSKVVLAEGIDLVVVGPEAPLSAGVADEPRERGIAVFGPNKAAAQLESSKTFAKRVMTDAGVPTGGAVRAGNIDEVIQAINDFGAPYVIKADGLAAGKGVIVTGEREAAIEHAKYWLQHGQVLVEEYLAGPEVSLFYFADGHNVLPLAPAQDFKRLLNHDEGPNTGGMGAYSPLPWLAEQFGSQEAFIAEVTEKIALPTVRQLESEGKPFIGLLYCGLVITKAGTKVIEFNARFGDPETQVVLARLKTPLSQLLLASATGTLSNFSAPEFSSDAAVTVVLASEGYPENAITGRAIAGIQAAERNGAKVLHAATALSDAGELLATGGRVLNVVATGARLSEAREAAYAAIASIQLEGSQYRTDIAENAAHLAAD